MSIVFFTSCAKKDSNNILSQLSKKEKKYIESFFFNLLLYDRGIYVLHGSKPISCSIIRFNSEYEEIKKHFPSSYQYQDWLRIKDRVPMTNYIITAKDIPAWNTPTMKEVYFVNVSNTLMVFLEYYDDFKKLYGKDFDPLEKIYEIQEEKSEFWDKILTDYYALGLIFGYGKNNSLCFVYMNKTYEAKGKYAQSILELPFNPYENESVLLDDGMSYQNFGLPPYRHLRTDAKLEQYKKEREKIYALYKNKNPLEVIFKQLTEKDDETINYFYVRINDKHYSKAKPKNFPLTKESCK